MPHSETNGRREPGKNRSLKHLGGVWLGKTIMGLTRITGRGGTTLPGRTALKYAPDLLSYLGRQFAHGSLVVTGTNGKTTTSHLLTSILREAGYPCVHNQSGSNLSWGVASSLIGASTWGASLPASIGVMEVDEGAFPFVVEELQPRGAVVTNIFRDQLDRFGDTDHIQKKIKSGLDALPAASFQVLNADDPSLAGMPGDRSSPTWYYGLELKLPPHRLQGAVRNIKSCPRCHHRLHYDRVYFAHLGRYRCPQCRFSRPEPHVALVDRSVREDGQTVLKLRLHGEPLELTCPLLGIYNLYNVLAAASCARALNASPAAIAAAIAAATPSFGRMERFTVKGRTLVMALVKNAVGANEVLRTLMERRGQIHLLIAINDRIADGTDISWLWDVDFEQLATSGERLAPVVVSGQRAWDMAVRLKYAGIEPGAIIAVENSRQALLQALKLTPPGEILLIMPTYTAMFDLRRALNALGISRPRREGSTSG